MTLATCFWVLMLLFLVFGSWRYHSDWSLGAPNLLLFLILLILGWHNFGPPIR